MEPARVTAAMADSETPGPGTRRISPFAQLVLAFRYDRAAIARNCLESGPKR
jgi:hypothetical protein